MRVQQRVQLVRFSIVFPASIGWTTSSRFSYRALGNRFVRARQFTVFQPRFNGVSRVVEFRLPLRHNRSTRATRALGLVSRSPDRPVVLSGMPCPAHTTLLPSKPPEPYQYPVTLADRLKRKQLARTKLGRCGDHPIARHTRDACFPMFKPPLASPMRILRDRRADERTPVP